MGAGMFQDLVLLEKQRIFTPLGIRFWDFAQDRTVDDGLVVQAASIAGVAPVTAMRTRSGVYAFQQLPGLMEVEYPRENANVPASPPRALSFVIFVHDLLSRFLPQVFSVELPLPYRGVFLSNEVTSPPDAAARAYLFSSPTRPTPSGCASVRAQLLDKSTGAPAAHAVVRVSVAGTVWIGIADASGAVAVYFPYPALDRLSLGSPPGLGQGTIFNTTWPATAQVQSQPSKLTFPLSGMTNLSLSWQNTPGLKSVLNDQAGAPVWTTEAGPSATTFSTTLQFDQEAVLRTGAVSTQGYAGYLLITAAP
jgi:hypothetical protein